MSYLDTIFTNKINKDNVKLIFELGSRDLHDALKLQRYFNSKVYAFECNPDCLVQCGKTMDEISDNNVKQNIVLVDKAVALKDGDITFYPFDLSKYDNMGSSSMLKIDFSTRNPSDPDYNRANPQKEIIVNGTRLDTFCNNNSISSIDMICIDLQGYELNALKSLGDYLYKVKYIITECSIMSTYTNGATFKEISEYLANYNIKYSCSNRFGNKYPNLNIKGFSEFDALFINESQ